MKNVKVTVRGQTLTIEVDLAQTHGPSSSGKTTIIATTEGNVPLPDHPEIKLGLNLYKPRAA